MTSIDTPTTNWAGNVTFGARRVHRPASVEELAEIVAGAESVKVLGSGHSFNRVADTAGELVRVDGLPAAVEVAADRRTARVAGGMRYAEVAALLHAEGLALPNMASLPHISVAGCCATGTHGSGIGLRGLASAVRGVRLLRADGSTVELDRGDARFAGLPVNLGALGVVTHLTLEVEPGFEVAQWVRTGLPLDHLRTADGLAEVFGAAYSVSVFTDWASGAGTVLLKRRVDRDGADSPGARWLGTRAAEGPWHPVPGMPPAHTTAQLGEVGPWHERLPHFRPDFTPSNGVELQSEYFLPREAAGEMVVALRGLGELMRPVLQISELRMIAADELWLSPTSGRDTVAAHFTWVRDAEAVRPVLAAIEERLRPLGARAHWGKVNALDPAEMAADYPRAADFRALMSAFDPRGAFRNAFLDAAFPVA